MGLMGRGKLEDSALEGLLARAVDGDAQALEDLVAQIRDDIYRLALRMVWEETEAEDAAQEILTKVVTKLGSFAGRSTFRTWYYRVATNHLLDRRRTQYESLTFASLGADLLDGLADPSPHHQPELELLANEVMRNCTRAMLQCLDRNARLAYLLGDVLELPGPTAAEILEIDAATFRKRLARARGKIRSFMAGNCGLVNPDAPCRCTKRVNRAVELGRVRAPAEPNDWQVERAVAEIDQIQRIAALMRSTVDETAPDALGRTLGAAIGNLSVVGDES